MKKIYLKLKNLTLIGWCELFIELYKGAVVAFVTFYLLLASIFGGSFHIKINF